MNTKEKKEKRESERDQRARRNRTVAQKKQTQGMKTRRPFEEVEKTMPENNEKKHVRHYKSFQEMAQQKTET